MATVQIAQTIFDHAWLAPLLLIALMLGVLARAVAKIISTVAWVLCLWAAGVPIEERRQLIVDAARQALRLGNPCDKQVPSIADRIDLFGRR